MLAARNPDAVPNHPGSTNVQRAANVQLCSEHPSTWSRLALTFLSDYVAPSRSNQVPQTPVLPLRPSP
jgi:hypothetical protein